MNILIAVQPIVNAYILLISVNEKWNYFLVTYLWM